MNGVRVRFLNRDEIFPRLMAIAKELLALKPDVMEVSLFGSLAQGNYAPGSDADIYILLREDARKFTDRIPEFLGFFSKIGLPVEVFPYTLEDIEKMKNSGFIKAIQKGKRTLVLRNNNP
jgi:predicted nucleotidyltransferase